MNVIQSDKKVRLLGQNGGHSAFISHWNNEKTFRKDLIPSVHGHSGILENSKLSAGVSKKHI